MGKTIVAGIATILAAAPATAQQYIDPVDVSNSGDTAWVLTSTALILLMAIPGLALFYGGLVRSKNFLSVLIQCFAIAGIISILWVVVGYTLAFGPVSSGILGNGFNWMLGNLGNVREGTAIPESAFAMFHMTFAIIACALMVGAWVGRARFGWVITFCSLWLLVVFAPVAHWVWGGGWLAQLGVLDFAGGIVVHTTAGISSLVIAIMMGNRIGWPKTLMLPHSPAFAVAGAGLLWVGWLGLNGGSALTATDNASAAVINTHVAAAMASLIWILMERIKVGKSTTIGAATGAIAGLAAITPASGYIGPGGALIIGAAAAFVCFFAIGLVKNGFKIDDSLDVFAIHAVGGIFGSLMLAIFLGDSMGGVGYADDMAFGSQFIAQLIGVGVVVIWSAIATAVLGFGISFILPMRVSEDDERDGLDIANHGERALNID
ncbi:ammonium transporter [Parasphingorhabdus sp. JC815]|uniref:ammonium transporter n=1 Tax=Parasphingorhabdus sp. JC815 TaxID=3232140 RepID=UPI00345A1FAA